MLIHVTVPDVDSATARAVAAGATLTRPPADQGHGRRSSKLTDPFGHNWMLSSFAAGQ